MIFKGEYLKKNRKEKEYNKNGIVKFEGKYKNGERNGKGKEYLDGNIRFAGEYLNGERNGKRREFDKYGGLEFEG